MRRLSFDGAVLDAAGVDVTGQSNGDIASAGEKTWLLASQLDGNGDIVGRFIGEGVLPAPPDANDESPAKKRSDSGCSLALSQRSDDSSTWWLVALAGFVAARRKR